LHGRAKGRGFDADQANPVQDQGDGSCPISRRQGKRATLQKALDTARAGLKSADLAAASSAPPMPMRCSRRDVMRAGLARHRLSTS